MDISVLKFSTVDEVGENDHICNIEASDTVEDFIGKIQDCVIYDLDKGNAYSIAFPNGKAVRVVVADNFDAGVYSKAETSLELEEVMFKNISDSVRSFIPILADKILERIK